MRVAAGWSTSNGATWGGLTHVASGPGQAALNQALLLTCAAYVGNSLHFSKLPVSSHANRDENSAQQSLGWL